MSDRAERLRASDPEVRRAAVAELAALHGEALAAPLVAMLGDEDWRVRKEAVALARERARDEPGLLDALGACLSPGENVGLRNACVEVLAGAGEAAVRLLDRLVGELDDDGRKLAAEALGRCERAAAVSLLERLVGDRDPNVRATALESLGALGALDLDRVAPLLVLGLAAPTAQERAAALDGIARLGVVAPWPRVEPLLQQPGLQRAALLVAARSGGELAVPHLVRVVERARGPLFGVGLGALADLAATSPGARDAARRALAGAGEEVRSAVHRATADENVAQRVAAVLVLGLLGGATAADACVAALDDLDVAAAAEEALLWLQEEGLDALARGARTGDVAARSHRLELLARLGGLEHRDRVLPALMQTADEGGPDELSRAVLRGIALAGDESCFPTVIARLDDGQGAAVQQAAQVALVALASRHGARARELAESAVTSAERHAALVILAALGGGVFADRAREVAFVTEALSGGGPVTRRVALEAIAALGAAELVEQVAFSLGDEEREVRLAAVRALGRLRRAGAGGAIERLLELLETTSDDDLLAAALEALGQTEDARAVAAITLHARSGIPLVAVAAVQALGALPEAQRIEPLTVVLAHGDPEVAKAAMMALGDVTDPRALVHLGACLDHEAWDVRRLAADLLGQRRGDVADRLLRARLEVESDPLVREALQRALTESDPTLVRLRSHPPGGRR